MKVLSLFDGMSCGQIALDQLGIKPTKYYASEVDNYAIAVTQHNYPDTIQLGDVTKWREWDIDWSEIDLIYGGSPCQGFSFAGKQLAFDDPRSALFFEMVKIIHRVNTHRSIRAKPPVKFLLENVRMKKEYLDVISEYMGVQPVMINSSLVSAQNRVRYYWTNIAEIEQPEDRGILLRDILETNASDEFTLNEKNLEHLNREFGSKGKDQTGKEKSCTITASMGTGGGNVPYVNRCIQDSDWETKLHWRKLTLKECERLQTVPDNYTLVPWQKRMMSNSQRYKMLGNGWTVEVIKHIFKDLNLKK